MEDDQFGDVKPLVESITMPLRHAGQYTDKESGLFYRRRGKIEALLRP